MNKSLITLLLVVALVALLAATGWLLVGRSYTEAVDEGPATGSAALWKEQLATASEYAAKKDKDLTLVAVSADPVYDPPDWFVQDMAFEVTFLFTSENNSVFAALNDVDPRGTLHEDSRSTFLPIDPLSKDWAAYKQALDRVKLGPRDVYDLTREDAIEYLAGESVGYLARINLHMFRPDLSGEPVRPVWSTQYNRPATSDPNTVLIHIVDAETGRILHRRETHDPMTPTPEPPAANPTATPALPTPTRQAGLFVWPTPYPTRQVEPTQVAVIDALLYSFTLPRKVIAQGSNTTPIPSSPPMISYRVEEVSLPVPATWEWAFPDATGLSLNAQLVTFDKAWYLTVTGGPFPPASSVWTLWLDSRIIGGAIRHGDTEIRFLILDSTQLRAGATIGVSFGQNPPSPSNILPETLHFSTPPAP